MFGFNSQLKDSQENQWRFELDNFVESNQKELAALYWGLILEWKDRKDTLGLDLKPSPHFVACNREAIEKLNENVDNKLQEILGILDGCKQEKEVVIIVIGNGQVKLINFKPEISPPLCWEESGKDIDKLVEILENRLAEINFGN